MAASYMYMAALLTEEADELTGAETARHLVPQSGELKSPKKCTYNNQEAFECEDGDFTVFVEAKGFPERVAILAIDHSNAHRGKTENVMVGEVSNGDSDKGKERVTSGDEDGEGDGHGGRDDSSGSGGGQVVKRSASGEEEHLKVKAEYQATNRSRRSSSRFMPY
ncbi:hypothetical protein QCA50_016952 [Cerrena zonata]|uniref:Uncharacterized protein n=1 Tax=Cerrena zonata TaxID=2478898 RepID=A0AAW0FGV3_9APHY